eukprot:SAG31_NODE_626_length_13460_cov_14.387517_12_plen_64_part_00
MFFYFNCHCFFHEWVLGGTLAPVGLSAVFLRVREGRARRKKGCEHQEIDGDVHGSHWRAITLG